MLKEACPQKICLLHRQAFLRDFASAPPCAKQAYEKEISSILQDLVRNIQEVFVVRFLNGDFLFLRLVDEI
jgi:hypothetical protein